MTVGIRIVCLWALFCFAFAGTAAAHRVNVFAYVEGDEVVVEGSFSKSNRVHGGGVTVMDAGSGEVFLTGKTDDEGVFRFKIPEAAKEQKADLRIVLQAGEGHRNEWTVESSEYSGASGNDSSNETSVAKPADPAGGSDNVDSAAKGKAALDEAVLRRVLDAELEKKLGPIRRMLTDEHEKGPGFVEIVGGVGWIFGLMGLVAYMRARKDV